MESDSTLADSQGPLCQICLKTASLKNRIISQKINLLKSTLVHALSELSEYTVGYIQSLYYSIN